MRKTLLIGAMVAGSVFAADAPMRLSTAFVKAGLKALITVKNAPRLRGDGRVQSVMDDAELAVSTKGDNAAFTEICRLRSGLEFDEDMPISISMPYPKEACSDAIAKILKSGKVPSLPLDSHGWLKDGLPECDRRK